MPAGGSLLTTTTIGDYCSPMTTTTLNITAHAVHDFPEPPDMPSGYPGQRRQKLIRLTASARADEPERVLFTARTRYARKDGTLGDRATYPSLTEALKVADPAVVTELREAVQAALARVTVAPT